MSRILKAIVNEVSPQNYDSDIDYYNALNRKPRSRAEPDSSEPEDPYQDTYRKQDAEMAKYKKEVNVQYANKEGVAPNGERYNGAFIVRAKNSHQGDNEIYKFNDAHWGAKKIVDTVKKQPDEQGEPYTTIVYYVDNHKHGYWKPWRDEPPISKGVEFGEEIMREGISQEDLADTLFHRLELRYPDVVKRYGHEVVGDIVLDVAGFHEGAEELGTSDISIMLRQIMRKLEEYANEQINELSPQTLASYKQKAGADASKSDRLAQASRSIGDHDMAQKLTNRANKRFSGIVKATKKEFNNDAKGLKEDFEDMPDELMDPAVWKKLPVNEKYKALMDAGLVEKLGSYYTGWLNGELQKNGKPYPDDVYTPYNVRKGELDLNKVYRRELAKYQDRKHGSDLTSQDREYELEIGSAGRAEIIRKANELAEMKRVTLRNERLQDEEVAFQRAETIQQRKDEMKKIADKYQHDLTVIDKEHRNNMESIRTGNDHEIKKIDKEHAEARREREHSSSESDKDRAEREREREQNRPKPEKPEPEYEPEEEPSPRPQGNKFDQDTGEPIRPQSNQWHTSQQVGYKPSKPNKDDDVTDVEIKPNKPLALGNNLKENSSSIFIGLVLAERMVMGASTDASSAGTIGEEDIDEDWQKTNKRDKTDGMSRKAVKAYRRENPGSKLKTAVTTKPSKLKKGSKSAKRRKSFCARMSGMKKSRASAKTKRDPDSPINKALRRWNCESVEQLHKLMMIAEQKVQQLREAANPAQQAAIAISMKKKGQKPKQESAIEKGIVDENLGMPYPGTYEQETAPFKRTSKQQRVQKIAFEGKNNVSR